MEETPTVDVVVGVHDEPHLAASCIDSLLSNTQEASWRLILIDDASDAFTRDLLRNYAASHSRIRLVRNSESSGFAETYCQGIETSNAKYTVLLSPDSMVPPGWLGKLVAVAKSDADIAMVSPLSNEAADLSVAVTPGGNYLSMNSVLARQSTARPFDVTAPVASCVLIRRRAVQIRQLSNEPPGSSSNDEGSERVRLADGSWRIVAAPNTYVYRVGEGNYASECDLKRIQMSLAVPSCYRGAQPEQSTESSQGPEPLGRVRNHLAVSARKTPLAFSPHHLIGRSLRLVARHRKNLVSLAFQPRKVLTALRSKIAARSAGIVGGASENPSAAVSPTRAYLERHTRRSHPSVVFIVEGLGLCGGCLRIVELVDRLISLGVEARLLVANQSYMPSEFSRIVRFAPVFFRDYDDLMENCPKCDVAVATLWSTAPYVRELVKRGRAKSSVNYLQDFEAWFYPDAPTQQQVLSTFSLIDNRVATSEWLRGLLNERGFEATVIPLGLDPLRFYPQPERERARVRIIAMARLWTPRRGFEHLLAALRHVRAHRPDVEIALFGSDDLQSSGKIDFPFLDLGVITDRSELCRQYSQADIFVDPSHFQAFGLPALEAMSCGLACVLTNVGGVNQYARDSVNALMVPPRSPQDCGAAILRLVNDGRLRRELGREGRKTVEGMPAAGEAEVWANYLAQVCSSFRKRRAAA